MSEKDFKKGMEVSSQAHEKFMEKQGSAVECVADEVHTQSQKIEKISRNVKKVKGYIISREKMERLKQCIGPDVTKIPEIEQQYLLSALYELSKTEGETTQFQKDYIASLQFYLGITRPQTFADLGKIEEIEDIKSQKAIYQCTLEFLTLGRNPAQYSDVQKQFLETFNLNVKKKEEISENIQTILGTIGLEGLSQIYNCTTDKEERRERVSRHTLTSRTDIEAIQKITEGWRNWEVSIVTPFLSCEDSDYEEYSSKSACRSAAENELRKLYNLGTSYFSPNSTKSAVKDVIKDVRDGIKADFEAIRHHLRVLNNFGDISEEVKRIETLTDSEAILKKLEFGLVEDVSDCQFEPFSSYAESIQIDNDDCESETGIWRLFEKAAVRYEYSIFDAHMQFDKDYERNTEHFSNGARRIVRSVLRNECGDRINEILDEVLVKFKLQEDLD